MRLRRAIERTVPRDHDLQASAAVLSTGYRSGGAAPDLDGRSAAAGYAVSRMPATFAAATRAFLAAAERTPAFAPSTLLDVGGGTGATAWAARAVWPSLDSLTLIDRAAEAVELGRRMAAASGDGVLRETRRMIASIPAELPVADVVTAGYLLGELRDEAGPIVDSLWAATGGLLVIVEPGSRAGFRTILAARDRLLAAGARIVAPCPGPEPCPVAASRATWCHFLARLERSPAHRRAKRASRSWEDEPFSYVAVARPEVVADPRPRVVLGRPRHHPGRVELRICADGRIETRVVSRREGPAYRAARDLAWGDAITMSGD